VLFENSYTPLAQLPIYCCKILATIRQHQANREPPPPLHVLFHALISTGIKEYVLVADINLKSKAWRTESPKGSRIKLSRNQNHMTYGGHDSRELERLPPERSAVVLAVGHSKLVGILQVKFPAMATSGAVVDSRVSAAYHRQNCIAANRQSIHLLTRAG
jgi:hypothetical protein